jgi:hypothetical protein
MRSILLSLLFTSMPIFLFPSVFASPVIETRLTQPYAAPDFAGMLRDQEVRFRANLERVSPLVGEAYLKALAQATANTPVPSALSEDELAEIFCHQGASPVSQFFRRTPSMRCVDGETVTSPSTVFEPENPNGIRGKKFAEFFYFLNLSPPDFQTWHKAKVLEFLSFAIENQPSDEQLNLSSAVFEKFLEISLENGFSPNVFWRRLGASPLVSKSIEIPNGISYVRTENGIAVAEELAGLTLSGGFPAVHRAATCAGTCVALEKSSFSAEIGVYSYAWQILFYNDVWPAFLSDPNGYPAIGGIGSNAIWFLWADFVAASDADDTLRATQFFKRSLDPLTLQLN